MAIRKTALKLSKIIYFIILFPCVGRILPPPESYIRYDIAKRFALFINDNESAESMYDAYSYVDWFTMLSISILVYILTMKIVRKIRE